MQHQEKDKPFLTDCISALAAKPPKRLPNKRFYRVQIQGDGMVRQKSTGNIELNTAFEEWVRAGSAAMELEAAPVHTAVLPASAVPF